MADEPDPPPAKKAAKKAAAKKAAAKKASKAAKGARPTPDKPTAKKAADKAAAKEVVPEKAAEKAAAAPAAALADTNGETQFRADNTAAPAGNAVNTLAGTGGRAPIVVAVALALLAILVLRRLLSGE